MAKKGGYAPAVPCVTEADVLLLRGFQMCYRFFGGFLRQVGMLQFAVIDSIIQARDAGIQMFIGGFRILAPCSLRFICSS